MATLSLPVFVYHVPSVKSMTKEWLVVNQIFLRVLPFAGNVPERPSAEKVANGRSALGEG